MTIQMKQFTPGKGAIYYFSGTGNTAFVACEFQDNYKKKGISIDLFQIEKIETVTSQGKYDFLMIGFPTYYFYPPQMVIDFVKKLPEVKDKPVILFATGGASAGASFNVLERILRKKKYQVISNFLYIMPSNDGFLFNKDIDKEEHADLKISGTKEKIKQDFELITSGKSKFKSANIFISLISEIAKFGMNKKNKWFWDKKECNFCGLCAKACPTKNITIKKEKGKVIFGNNCMFCSRCYNFCPKKAIHYKSINKTKNFKRYTRLKNEII